MNKQLNKGVKQLAQSLTNLSKQREVLAYALPLLNALYSELEQQYSGFINSQNKMKREEITEIEKLADMLKVMAFDLSNNEPSESKINIALMLSQFENLYRSIAQVAKAKIDDKAGYFYASEINLKKASIAFEKANALIDTSKPINFIEVH